MLHLSAVVSVFAGLHIVVRVTVAEAVCEDLIHHRALRPLGYLKFRGKIPPAAGIFPLILFVFLFALLCVLRRPGLLVRPHNSCALVEDFLPGLGDADPEGIADRPAVSHHFCRKEDETRVFLLDLHGDLPAVGQHYAPVHFAGRCAEADPDRIAFPADFVKRLYDLHFKIFLRLVREQRGRVQCLVFHSFPFKK